MRRENCVGKFSSAMAEEARLSTLIFGDQVERGLLLNLPSARLVVLAGVFLKGPVMYWFFQVYLSMSQRLNRGERWWRRLMFDGSSWIIYSATAEGISVLRHTALDDAAFATGMQPLST